MGPPDSTFATLPTAPVQSESERLWLRALRPGDGPHLSRLVQSNQERLAASFPKSVTEVTGHEAAAKYIGTKVADREARRGFWYGLWTKPDDTLIGQIQIKNIDWDTSRGELAFWIDAPFEGKGLLSEAMGQILAICFDTLGFNKAFLRTLVDNQRSMGLAARHGFVREGTLRQEFRSGRGLVDVHYFGLLREENDRRRSRPS